MGKKTVFLVDQKSAKTLKAKKLLLQCNPDADDNKDQCDADKSLWLSSRPLDVSAKNGMVVVGLENGEVWKYAI
jgi:hypothetical protein